MIDDNMKSLIGIREFAEAYKKLYLSEKLEEKEKEYILGCTLLLLSEYSGRDEKRSYFELAYQIILFYSVKYNDYIPLNDIAYNYGFFPIVRFINRKNLLDKVSINEILYDLSLENYKNDNYIETYEQHITRKNVLNAESDICFIAPTSSGKSSVISEHLKLHQEYNNAIIIVPTKSLLSQTYMSMRKTIKDRKIISHDEMYDENVRNLGVLTQERTSRLLEKNENLVVDVLYIDEAHNLFSNDSRNVLLARVIKMCKTRNSNLLIIYLSPFINNTENLTLNGIHQNRIADQRISFNIKEPNIYELRKDGNAFIYNRFFDMYTYLGNYKGYTDYIFTNCKKKNFFFIGSPKKIENYAEELYQHTEIIPQTPQVLNLKKIISKNVHESFKMLKYLDHGIIYLHAKVPDMLKDYLEYQFKTISDIKYLIANTVILEGINLPIDNLFILDARGKNSRSLLNLIGRVNRLNNVFDINLGDLQMLLPNIHFINSKYYHGNMKNKIEKLYQPDDDEILNPLLENYEVDRIKRNHNQKEKIIKQNKLVIESENIYFDHAVDDIQLMKKNIIKSGVNQLISIDNDNVKKIIKKINYYKKNIENNNVAIIDKVQAILVNDINVVDKTFQRLQRDAAIKYYKRFMKSSKQENLNAQIESQLEYFRGQERSGHNFMYIGSSFGECKGPYDEYSNMGNVYVDLREKNDVQIVNLLIVKTKIEQDFIGFQYLRAVNFLFDMEVITEEEYNMEIYGTTNKKKIALLKLGISPSLLKILLENNQINNIYFDDYGNIMGNQSLRDFYNTTDDYTKFEMRKYFSYK